ncbi:MAG: hypothetical protein GKC09_02565 [Methanosarcinales archaeon]|jgi:hypothetical protein|nr:hypothetical protein [Methanosarcinales archaeon]
MRSPGVRQKAGREMKYLQVQRQDDTMSTQKKKKKNDPESVRRRLQNSLPWALSRWFSRVILGKDLSKKK